MATKKLEKTNSIKKAVKPKVVKRGRKKLKLCKQDITDLAEIGCTNENIAKIMKCSADTIENNFSGACAIGRANMQKSIKKTQLDVAINDKNVQMLIWVGKQWCSQRDSRQEVEHKGEIPLIIKHFGTKEPRKWKEKKK